MIYLRFTKSSKMDSLISDLKDIISDFHKNMREYLPPLESIIDELIAKKSKNTNEIEHLLDTLLSMCQLGIGNALYIKLLEYYKTIDAEGAQFYWKEYDNLEE